MTLSCPKVSDDVRLSRLQETLQVLPERFVNLAEHSSRTLLPKHEIQTYQPQLLRPPYTMNTINITQLYCSRLPLTLV